MVSKILSSKLLQHSLCSVYSCCQNVAGPHLFSHLRPFLWKDHVLLWPYSTSVVVIQPNFTAQRALEGQRLSPP